MAFSGRFEPTPRRSELEEIIDDDGESDDEYDSDDSECDPSYSIEEKSNSKISRTSIRKKSKPLNDVDMELIAEADMDDAAPNVTILNENDEKDIHEVLQIIKGDACMGDVVMFEQKVYEMYNVASRSSIGPSCGTRTVAGRIVKESYGASKQQHTFTIEVLWSKGEKPLPPLHPLLIKGRNLYRMKTLRQTWEDEEERQKVLMEKHARGSLARSNREARVLEKEKRKTHKDNRISRREGFSENPSQSNLTSAGTMLAESMVSLSVDSRKMGIHQHQQGPLCGNPGKPLQRHQSENRTMQTKSDLFINHRKQPFQENYLTQPRIKVDPPASYNTQPRIYRADHAASVNKVLDGTNHTSWNQYRLPMGVYHHPIVKNQPDKQQRCRYYAEGRCYFGENCKFSHEMMTERRDEERWRHTHHARLCR